MSAAVIRRRCKKSEINSSLIVCAGLSLDQVDTLWTCLATDDECSDQCFHWLLQQSRTKEQHALSLDGFRHIFLERMPLLRPEAMSMTALNLYTCLCSLAKIANSSLKKPIDENLVSVGTYCVIATSF